MILGLPNLDHSVLDSFGTVVVIFSLANEFLWCFYFEWTSFE